MGWTKITLWKRVLVGLAIGMVVGLILHYGFGKEVGGAIAQSWLKPFGDAFVTLIKMLVVPLIFTTLISGILAMNDPVRLGSLGGRTIGLYMATTLVAVTLGLLAGTIFQPGRNVQFEDLEAANSGVMDTVQGKLDVAKSADGTVLDKLFAIIPDNIVMSMADGATGNVLQIIFFAILFGIACLIAGDRAKPVTQFIESAAEVMLKMTVMIMELAPFGVFFLISWVLATQGLGVLTNLALLTVALYTACIAHMILVHGFGIIRGGLKLPVIQFFRGIRDAQTVAFSTASSAGTLPVTIANVSENLGVHKPVAASVLPVGATINMDGTAIYLGIVALFGAQMMGIPVTPSMYLLVALFATLTSIGAAAVPSAGLLLAASVLTQVGLTEAQASVIIAFIFPFDRLLDMMRTVTNVTGDSAVASAVAKWEGELDEDIFRKEATM